jgi:hypothetical protein
MNTNNKQRGIASIIAGLLTLLIFLIVIAVVLNITALGNDYNCTSITNTATEYQKCMSSSSAYRKNYCKQTYDSIPEYKACLNSLF